jgi:hypothetical protein
LITDVDFQKKSCIYWKSKKYDYQEEVLAEGSSRLKSMLGSSLSDIVLL